MVETIGISNVHTRNKTLLHKTSSGFSFRLEKG